MNAPPQADAYFSFDNTYARLPDRFFARLPPTPVPAPRFIRLNDILARHLGLDPEALSSPKGGLVPQRPLWLLVAAAL